MTERVPQKFGTALLRFTVFSAGYWSGEARWRARLLLAAMVGLGILQVVLAVRLNLWSADLFDALEHRSSDRFTEQVLVFAVLVCAIMLVNALHLTAKRGLQVGWREWLTRRVLGEWMAEARHYQISLLPGDHDNPDGRIAEDIRIATEAAIELAHSALYCIMLFFSFAAILWSLSGTITVGTGGWEAEIDGHLVWLALLYAGIGSGLAFIVGGPLINVADRRQTAEANFRFGLAEAREHAEAIAMVQREARERSRLLMLFDTIRKLWNEQTVGLRRLLLFSSAYGVMATMFPILVSSPRYLAGGITLGALMQTGQAFQQITAALSWPIDNFPRLAELHASVDRFLALSDATRMPGHSGGGHHRAGIQISAVDGPSLAIRDLTIASPSSTIFASGISAEIFPGDRVLIAGDREIGQMLFKAVTGIWIWGSGTIELPDDASIVFLPRHPYLPSESLRSILAYPRPAEEVDDETCRDSLAKVGLERLTGSLDRAEDWTRSLTPADQQRLACANMLIQRPKWIFMDHATEQLEDRDELALLGLIFSELPEATVITNGERQGLDQLHKRKITLERQAGTEVSTHETAVKPPFHVFGGRFRKLLETIKEGFA